MGEHVPSYAEPDGDPVVDLPTFAQQLRDLRMDAGAPSYRQLARVAHYAPSTLVDAASGRRLPTREVTLAFVRACGGNEHEWTARWAAVADHLRASQHATAVPRHSQHVGAAHSAPSASSAPQPTSQAPRRSPTASLRRYGSKLRAVSAAAALVTIGAAVGWALADLQPDTSPAAVPVTATASAPMLAQAADGADPNQAGCNRDAVTADASPVYATDGTLLGTLELRTSATCRAAWARYEPGATPQRLTTVQITIRSTNGRQADFTAPANGLPFYSDLLHSDRYCVQAAVTLQTTGQSPVAATTRCWKS